jgi:DNA polymerase delta subunit 1
MESERTAKKRKLGPTNSFNKNQSQLSQQPSFADVLERLKEEAAGVVGEFHSLVRRGNYWLRAC